MRAAVIHAIGSEPRTETISNPSPATDNQVLIQVQAAALNSIDLHIAAGHHRAGEPQLPYVPGLETVGVIINGPRGRPPSPHAGSSGAGPRRQRRTRRASVGRPSGLRAGAGRAGQRDGRSDRCRRHLGRLALAKAELRPGESVLVLGATGPFGNAFVQLAKHAGAQRVIAAARHADRLARLTDVDDVVILGDEPLPTQLDKLGGPVELVVDPVWGQWAEPALRCLKPGGRYLNVGAAAGDDQPFHVELLRASQLTLLGFSAAAANPSDMFDSYDRIAALALAGSLTLPTTTYTLSEADQAWAAQASSPGRKIIVVP